MGHCGRDCPKCDGTASATGGGCGENLAAIRLSLTVSTSWLGRHQAWPSVLMPIARFRRRNGFPRLDLPARLARNLPELPKSRAPLYRCQNCGSWVLGGELRENNRYGALRSPQADVEYLTADVAQARRQFPKDKLKVYALGSDGMRGLRRGTGHPGGPRRCCPQCATSVQDLLRSALSRRCR